MSYTKLTKENAHKYMQYKQAEANFRKTIVSKTLQEQRDLVQQFNIKWWSSN